MKKWLYTAGGLIIGVVLLVIAIALPNTLNQQKALSQIEHYLTTHYPQLDYEILGVSTSTNFKHYGYFDQSISVKDNEKREIFYVYYDKSIERMEDSINIKRQEIFLENAIKPKIEQYVEKQFDHANYINVGYAVETGKPSILVKLEEGSPDIEQVDFDAFVTYVKEELAIEHALIIIDYWMGELSFNEDF